MWVYPWGITLASDSRFIREKGIHLSLEFPQEDLQLVINILGSQNLLEAVGRYPCLKATGASFGIMPILVTYFLVGDYPKPGLEIGYTMVTDPTIAVVQRREDVRFDYGPIKVHQELVDLSTATSRAMLYLVKVWVLIQDPGNIPLIPVPGYSD